MVWLVLGLRMPVGIGARWSSGWMTGIRGNFKEGGSVAVVVCVVWEYRHSVVEVLDMLLTHISGSGVGQSSDGKGRWIIVNVHPTLGPYKFS
jgi:hypothetical protein